MPVRQPSAPEPVSLAVDTTSPARVGLLSTAYRQRLVARAAHGLYRWYLDRSQKMRNWNPDRSFDWPRLRADHSSSLVRIVEGYYAVEQYAPDYTTELTRLTRARYGHSQFQIRWGAEEEKHSDLWRNVLLFGRARTPEQLEKYTAELRATAWQAPFDTPLQMLFYTVFQERATQLIYLNTARISRGEHPDPRFAQDLDPVLAEAVAAIAVDEAAHYDFFLGLSRLHLYYFPEDTLDALAHVLRHFVMPAASIMPDYDSFVRELYEANLFGPRIYGKEVAKPTLAALGVTALKDVEAGLRRSRETPGLDGQIRPASGFDGCDFSVVESGVRGVFERIGRFEAEVGLAAIDPISFEPLHRGQTDPVNEGKL